MKRKFADALNFNLMDGKFFVAKEDRVDQKYFAFQSLTILLCWAFVVFSKKGKIDVVKGKRLKTKKKAKKALSLNSNVESKKGEYNPDDVKNLF